MTLMDNLQSAFDWRQKGNGLYREALEKNDQCERLDLLTRAITCYSSSLKKSKNEEEKSSSEKNCAQTHWKLGLTMQVLQKPHIQVSRHFHEAFTFYQKALTSASGTKSKEWVESLIGCYKYAFQTYQDYLSRSKATEESRELSYLVDVITYPDVHICVIIAAGDALCRCAAAGVDRKPSSVEDVSMFIMSALNMLDRGNKVLQKYHQLQNDESPRIHTIQSRVIELAINYAKNLPGTSRANMLLQVGIVLHDEHQEEQRFRIMDQIQHTLFGLAVCAREAEEYTMAIHHLKECNFPVEEALRLAGRKRNVKVIRELETRMEEIYQESCIAESMIILKKGDVLQDRALNEEESLSMELVWESLDMYRLALQLIRGKDVEIEAIVQSRIGKIFHNILHIKTKARESCKQAIELALSLHPKTFDQKEWFRDAKRILSSYQQQTLLEQEQRDREKNAGVLASIKEEIKALEAESALDNGIALLDHVYKKHPPKRDTFKLKPTYRTDTKKALQIAITHYHPDRQDEERDGLKWKVLCQEITKFLSAKYEYFKSL